MSDTFSFIYPNLVFLENNEGVQSLAGVRVKRFFRHPTSGTVLLGVEGTPGLFLVSSGLRRGHL